MAVNTLTATAKASLVFSAQVTRDYANSSQNIDYAPKNEITAAGTGANQANQVWEDERTIAASGTETLDLNDGTLTNGFGQAVALTAVKFLQIENKNTAGEMVVGGATSSAFSAIFADTTDKLTIRRSGILLVGCTDATAYTVSSSAKKLLIANSDTNNTLTYRIAIVGKE